MTAFVLFGGILALLATAIVWSAVRAGADADRGLDPFERRDAAIEALRQLEFEYGTGKMSDDEYVAIRDRLRREALAARDAARAAGCPSCGASVADATRFCPACGHALAEEPPAGG